MPVGPVIIASIELHTEFITDEMAVNDSRSATDMAVKLRLESGPVPSCSDSILRIPDVADTFFGGEVRTPFGQIENLAGIHHALQEGDVLGIHIKEVP